MLTSHQLRDPHALLGTLALLTLLTPLTPLTLTKHSNDPDWKQTINVLL